MKYIVMQVKSKKVGTLEIPFLFPEIVVHSDMAKAAAHLLRGQFQDGVIVPISAGFFCSPDLDIVCHGKSESLNLESRPKVDSQLIMMSDYGSIYA